MTTPDLGQPFCTRCHNWGHRYTECPIAPPEPIRGFQFPDRSHSFLSNFYPSPIVVDGITYPTVEHAYQRMKFLSPGQQWLAELLQGSAGNAKRMGRRVQCRPDWEQVKIGIMRSLLRLKFAPGSMLAHSLLGTGDGLLEEANDWGDRFWGTVNGVGHNWLGFLLMGVRAELRGSQ